jgi:ankyrin repeat protein
MAKLLLERGADPNKLGCGKTPLSWAAGREHREVAKLLVEKGADPALDMVADYYHWL